MKNEEDRYEEALDAIRDAQGDEWFAYSGPDIEAAEEQATGGSVITGTLREEDLIPAFMEELKRRHPEAAVALTDQYSFDGWPFTKYGLEFAEVFWGKCEELAPHLLEDLSDALKECAPEGTRFVASKGDGTDFGFWATEEEL